MGDIPIEDRINASLDSSDDAVEVKMFGMGILRRIGGGGRGGGRGGGGSLAEAIGEAFRRDGDGVGGGGGRGKRPAAYDPDADDADADGLVQEGTTQERPSVPGGGVPGGGGPNNPGGGGPGGGGPNNPGGTNNPGGGATPPPTPGGATPPPRPPGGGAGGGRVYSPARARALYEHGNRGDSGEQASARVIYDRYMATHNPSDRPWDPNYDPNNPDAPTVWANNSGTPNSGGSGPEDPWVDTPSPPEPEDLYPPEDGPEPGKPEGKPVVRDKEKEREVKKLLEEARRKVEARQLSYGGSDWIERDRDLAEIDAWLDWIKKRNNENPYSSEDLDQIAEYLDKKYFKRDREFDERLKRRAKEERERIKEEKEKAKEKAKQEREKAKQDLKDFEEMMRREREGEGKPEGKPEAPPEATPEPTPEEPPEGTPEPGKPEEPPEGKPEPTPEATPEKTPEGEPEAAPEDKPEATPEPGEGTPEPGKPEEPPEATPEEPPEAPPEETPTPEEIPEPGEPEETPTPEAPPEPTPEEPPEAPPEPPAGETPQERRTRRLREERERLGLDEDGNPTGTPKDRIEESGAGTPEKTPGTEETPEPGAREEIPNPEEPPEGKPEPTPEETPTPEPGTPEPGAPEPGTPEAPPEGTPEPGGPEAPPKPKETRAQKRNREMRERIQATLERDREENIAPLLEDETPEGEVKPVKRPPRKPTSGNDNEPEDTPEPPEGGPLGETPQEIRTRRLIELREKLGLDKDGNQVGPSPFGDKPLDDVTNLPVAPPQPDVVEAQNGLPPIPEGHRRLFRGDIVDSEGTPLGSTRYVAPGLEEEQYVGMWWAEDARRAEGHAFGKLPPGVEEQVGTDDLGRVIWGMPDDIQRRTRYVDISEEDFQKLESVNGAQILPLDQQVSAVEYEVDNYNLTPDERAEAIDRIAGYDKSNLAKGQSREQRLSEWMSSAELGAELANELNDTNLVGALYRSGKIKVDSMGNTIWDSEWAREFNRLGTGLMDGSVTEQEVADFFRDNPEFDQSIKMALTGARLDNDPTIADGFEIGRKVKPEKPKPEPRIEPKPEPEQPKAETPEATYIPKPLKIEDDIWGDSTPATPTQETPAAPETPRQYDAPDWEAFANPPGQPEAAPEVIQPSEVIDQYQPIETPPSLGAAPEVPPIEAEGRTVPPRPPETPSTPEFDNAGFESLTQEIDAAISDPAVGGESYKELLEKLRAYRKPGNADLQGDQVRVGEMIDKLIDAGLKDEQQKLDDIEKAQAAVPDVAPNPTTPVSPDVANPVESLATARSEHQRSWEEANPAPVEPERSETWTDRDRLDYGSRDYKEWKIAKDYREALAEYEFKKFTEMEVWDSEVRKEARRESARLKDAESVTLSSLEEWDDANPAPLESDPEFAVVKFPRPTKEEIEAREEEFRKAWDIANPEPERPDDWVFADGPIGETDIEANARDLLKRLYEEKRKARFDKMDEIQDFEARLYDQVRLAEDSDRLRANIAQNELAYARFEHGQRREAFAESLKNPVAPRDVTSDIADRVDTSSRLARDVNERQARADSEAEQQEQLVQSIKTSVDTIVDGKSPISIFDSEQYARELWVQASELMERNNVPAAEALMDHIQRLEERNVRTRNEMYPPRPEGISDPSTASGSEAREAATGLAQKVDDGLDAKLGGVDSAGFHLPGEVATPAEGEPGIHNAAEAKDHVSGGGALSEVPDDLLANSIVDNSVDVESLELPRFSTYVDPEDIQTYVDQLDASDAETIEAKSDLAKMLADEKARRKPTRPDQVRVWEADKQELIDFIADNPTSERFLPIGGSDEGANGLQMFYDRETKQRIAIKYGNGVSTGIREDFSEMLGGHIAERFGFATSSFRWGGPRPVEQAPIDGVPVIPREHGVGDTGSVARPIVIELAQNSFGDDISMGIAGQPTDIGADDLISMTLLDWTILNDDRHIQNIMSTRDAEGKVSLIPIDHGMAFGAGFNPHDPEASTLSEWSRSTSGGGRMTNPLVLEIIERSQRGRDNWVETRAELISAIQRAQERLRDANSAKEVSAAIAEIMYGAGADFTASESVTGTADRIQWILDTDPDSILESIIPSLVDRLGWALR